ncbi:DUF1349 domain-containing protein [Vibrio sp. HN007]|uniref:DUF1349 domain-containing protein n=1 Tax=Vibrio iocasae TaxID=3098914 RepID=UPI0035D44D34
MNDIQNWIIMNNNSARWSVDDRKLTVQVSEGNIWGYGSPEVENIFIKPVEQRKYSAQVDINILPKRAYEQAGLGIFWDSNNYIKISKEMFNDRLSLVFVTERDGNPQVNSLVDYSERDVIVKLEKSDGLITAFYRKSDEDAWLKMGEAEALPGSEQGVMLYTFSGSQLDPTIATFENFTLDY